ncbi:MAG: hypothetical protein LBM75_07105 [Myxococcales bacterium]|jgi:glycosidase|nr:hypothetical protein [Myxococcales bacterium]
MRSIISLLPSSALKFSFLLLSLSLASLLQACDGSGGSDAPAIEAQTGSASFAYRPSQSISSIYVVGGWNDYDRSAHPMTGPDATGTYTVELSIPCGEWGYFFLVDGVVTLDPEADETITEGEQTYSRLEVVCEGALPSAARVTLTVRQGSLSNERPSSGQGAFGATIDITSKGSLDALQITGTLRSTDGSTRSLTSSELALSASGDQTHATVSLSGLTDGKYNVLIEAQNGAHSSDILLPFWIEATPFSFYDGILYMAMTDRFRNGSTSNDSPVNGSEGPVNFQGGDLLGITQAIEDGYLTDLGVRSIWLTSWQTPPSRAHTDWIDGVEVHVTGFHGYWPISAREVDPRLGGADALHAMVRAAHAKGIRIVMDTVLNHVHEDHEYVLEHSDWFRRGANCKDDGGWRWDHPTEGLICLFDQFLPDVDWTKDRVSTQFLDDVQWWVETFDLDGLRVDAAKHMEEDVMGKLGTKMRKRFETAGTHFYMFGETYTSDIGILNKYIGNGQLDGQLDFLRFMDGANEAFVSDGNGLDWVAGMTKNSIDSFGDAMMVTFVGNHDVARFISKADDSNRNQTGNKWNWLPSVTTDQNAYDRLWMAMFHLMTTPGVPLIYYGDEYGEHGGSDPDNRHFLKTQAQMSDQQKAQLDRMKKLTQVRNSLRGLKRGSFETMWVNQDPWGQSAGNLWAYVRRDPEGDPKHNAVMVLNLTYNTWTGVGLHSNDGVKLTDLGWESGTLQDLLTGTEYVLQNGSVTVDVPARGGVILALK